MESLQGATAIREEDADDTALVEGLRAGDEAAFASLVERYGPSMLRAARLYVRSPEVAEDVVQETWLCVLRSVDGFQHRSSLRTWMFTILAHCAFRRSRRERRYLPHPDAGGEGPSVSSTRFFPASHPRWAGMWTTRVDDWDGVPEDQLIAGEGLERLRTALDELPATQALVFVLRDVDGWSGPEVCELLRLSAQNQRVLLHRARTRIRARMEEYLGERE